MPNDKRGFASMDKNKQRDIASKGGKSSSGGFSSMDKDKQKNISSKGGKSSHSGGRSR
jgi:uncharacterized protein